MEGSVDDGLVGGHRSSSSTTSVVVLVRRECCGRASIACTPAHLPDLERYHTFSNRTRRIWQIGRRSSYRPVGRSIDRSIDVVSCFLFHYIRSGQPIKKICVYDAVVQPFEPLYSCGGGSDETRKTEFEFRNRCFKYFYTLVYILFEL